MSKAEARCPWCGNDPLYQDYHDQVWGRPVGDSRDLFAKLCLDGQQAGLSWITILRKQANYEAAFDQFDPLRIARYDETRVRRLLADPGIVRNRLKVESIVANARAFLAMEEQGEGFARFLWQFVDGRPRINDWSSIDEVPAKTPASEAMSRALRSRGFKFVGPTICYAFMQAVGMVNDHLLSCPSHQACSEQAARFQLP